MLMHNLESEARVSALADYKELADEATSLRLALKSCQAMLASEHGRIERQDEKIRDLKDKIAARKWLRSMALTTMLLTQPVTQSRHEPTSRPTAPIPARAQTGLVTQISSPGLASHMDGHPKTVHFDNPSGDFAGDRHINASRLGEHDPNWDSDASIWAQMKGPEDTKAPGKKHKKRVHDSEHQSYGLSAIHEKVMREYLTQSSTNTIDDEALTMELRSAHPAFALQEAERARNVVILTLQFVELSLYTKYKGGKHYHTGTHYTCDGASALPARLLSTKECRVV
jgi:hypothetical protein